MCVLCVVVLFFQAEDGIRDLVRSRGLGDVYKRQPDMGPVDLGALMGGRLTAAPLPGPGHGHGHGHGPVSYTHLTLPTSDLV